MAHFVQRRQSTLSTSSVLPSRKLVTKPKFLKAKAGSSHFRLNNNGNDSAPASHQKPGCRTQLKELKQNYAQSPFVKSVEQNLQNPSISTQRQQMHLIENYGDQIQRYLRHCEQTNEDCLSKHGITTSYRAKMADWMVEVLTSFSCAHQTFFLAMDILDRYLKEKQEFVPEGQLHIIGVTCMFIASKFSDVFPLSMETVFEHIAQKKILPDEIIAQELDILKTLQFKIAVPSTLEFLEAYICNLFKKDDENLVDIEVLKNMGVYLAKMCFFDYELCEVKPSLLATGSLFVASKICEQLSGNTVADAAFMDALSKESLYTEEQLVEVAQKILENAQNFEIQHPGLDNLKKAHFGSSPAQAEDTEEE